jgi:hypothetical protein
LLDYYDKLVPYICPSQANCISVLHHPDLRLENIFVDPKEFKITSIIDWQGTCALPLFKQIGYPPFLSNNGNGVSKLRELSKLPSNFDSLDADEKEQIKEAHIRRLACQLYIITTIKHNRVHFEALKMKNNALRAELLTRAGMPWDGDLVIFRGALLDILDHWKEFSSDEFPLEFFTETISRWRDEEKEWLEASDSLSAFRQDLGINEEGWVPAEYYAESFQRNQELRRAITETADVEFRKKIWKVWPFKEDEDISEWEDQRRES